MLSSITAPFIWKQPWARVYVGCLSRESYLSKTIQVQRTYFEAMNQSSLGQGKATTALKRIFLESNLSARK